MTTQAEKLFVQYLRALGINPDDDPELASTGRRFSELLRERFNPRAPLTSLEALATPTTDSDLVVVRGISFRSLCAHHIVPFFGTVSIAFIPDGSLVGFGALSRLVAAAAGRPQIQERLVASIAATIDEQLRPRGIVVASRARQMCMEFTGTEVGAETIATAARGCLTGESGRTLALELLR